MLKALNHDEVIQIRMSRELNGEAVYWVAAYLVDGLLIDTGCRHTARELVEYLRVMNVRAAVNTHYHEDHCGGNRDIMDAFGVPIYAHEASIPRIAQAPRLYSYQELAWGYPEPTRVRPIPDIVKTERFAFNVVETPGHCDGHVCLVELSKGWCFSGDLFTREEVKFIRPEEDMSTIIASMQALLDLPIEKLVLFTAMGRIVEDGRRALSCCIETVQELADKAWRLERDGADPDEIMARIFGGEHIFAQLTDNQFSTKNLVRSLLDLTGSHRERTDRI